MAIKSKPLVKGHGWKIWLGIVISILFVYLALRNIEFDKLMATFKQLNPVWLIPGTVLIFIVYFIKSLLWQMILGKKYVTHRWTVFRIITIGFFANNILPLRLGEVVRAWLLSKKEKLPMSTALAVIIMERGSDLIAMLVYFLLMMLLVPFQPWLKLSGAVLAGVGIVFILVILLNYRFGGHIIEKIEKPLEKLHPKIGPFIHKQLDKFFEGLKLITSWQQVSGILLLALCSWFLWSLVAATCIYAMDVQLPITAAFFLIVVLNFGLMIPASPGGIGVFEFMVIVALAPFGVEKETALGIGLTFHMLQYVVTLIAGWLFSVQMSVSLSNVYQRPDDYQADVLDKD